MRQARAKHRRGMTLVEILFAFAIVATVLTLSYAAALNAWRSAVAANQRTQAQYLVQQGMESVRAYRESSGFVWDGTGGFISSLPAIGDAFHMELEQNDGTSSANNFVCSFSPCQFKVESGTVGLNAVGTASHSGTPSIRDVTVYTLAIRPVNYFVKDNDAPQTTGSIASASDPVTSITFEATITWTDANNVVSNLKTSTIITRP